LQEQDASRRQEPACARVGTKNLLRLGPCLPIKGWAAPVPLSPGGQKTIVAFETGRPEKVPLLFAVSPVVLPAEKPAAHAGGEEENSGSPALADVPRANPPERRIYRGAVYEKGEDCQWHLLHE
jgi:hypothetical protein